MNPSLVKFAAAFAMGTGATAGLVEVVRRLPIPGYVKTILCWVLPIPPISMGLAMFFCGPQPETTPAEFDSQADVLKTIFFGLLGGPFYIMVFAVLRWIQELRHGNDPMDVG